MNRNLIKKIHPPLIAGERKKYDDPKKFLELSSMKQTQLVNWILNNFDPGKTINHSRSSYGLKHYFSNDVNGFYICNGAFKGAMMIAGFHVYDDQAQNWYFNIKQSSINNLYKSKVDAI